MPRHRLLALVFALLALVVTACGGGDSVAGANDQQCFTEVTTDQRMQIEQYAQQQGQTVNTVAGNDNGTQDVCVIDANGQQHFYSQNDGFADYYLYAAMFGHSSSLATYGLLTGDLSPLDYVMLQSLVGVNSRGGVYHPYTSTSTGWARQPTVVKNVHVTNVYYGNSTKAQAFGKAKPPAGYRPATVPKADSDKVAKVAKTGAATAVAGVSAKSLIKHAQKVPPGSPAARNVAVPRPAYKNPSKNSGSPSGSGSNKPKSSVPSYKPPKPKPSGGGLKIGGGGGRRK